MLFQGKIDRAMRWLHDRSDSAKAERNATEEGNLPSMEELRREALAEEKLEKGDLLAMLVAALITFLPVALVVLLVMVSVLLVVFFIH